MAGMLTLPDLSEAVHRGDVETVLVVFPDLYGRLMGKRVQAQFFVDSVADGGMHACDYLLTCDMEMDVVDGYQFATWERGYGDMHAQPDMSTLRMVTWLPKTAMVLCDLAQADHAPVRVSPRQILRQQIAVAAELGFEAFGGSEIELYVFDDSYAQAHAKHYHDLRPAGRYNEDYHILQGTREEPVIGAIRRHLEASGVPVEASKGEAGIGQQEINLRFGSVLTQCDANVIYKHAAKEIADSLGKSVTFMAKWHEQHTGSSAHIHMSLRDMQGKPVFAGDVPLGPVHSSDVFRWFLGGWMRYAADFALCFAPYPTSYKRYQSRSWAPTALAWSYDNRTAGFRVVGHGSSLRVECRVPGADANPYIAYAAALAAGLAGIRERIEPPPPFTGDIYAARDLPQVPRTLTDAMVRFATSEVAKAAFGADVHAHLLRFAAYEQEAFERVVTSWERARYFERA